MIDIRLDWKKARACAESGCVEVAELPSGGKAVRDGKDPTGPVLLFDAVEWKTFTSAVTAGEFR